MKARTFFLTAILAVGIWTMMPATAGAQKKQEAHMSYVLKNLKLDSQTKAKFEPVLKRYYSEVATAKSEYKKLKDKYDELRDTGKLSDAQCDLLFNGKLKQERAELDVREKYYAEFKKVLSIKQAYQAIRLCNDKVE